MKETEEDKVRDQVHDVVGDGEEGQSTERNRTEQRSMTDFVRPRMDMGDDMRDKIKKKLGCASVKLHVWLEFCKFFKDLINFG